MRAYTDRTVDPLDVGRWVVIALWHGELRVIAEGDIFTVARFVNGRAAA